MKDEDFYRSMLSHSVPRRPRRVKGWLGLGTKHPRCDGCGRQIWPGDDHGECKEA